MPLIATCAAPTQGRLLAAPPRGLSAPPPIINRLTSITVPAVTPPVEAGPYAVGVMSLLAQRTIPGTGEARWHEVVLWYPAGEAARGVKPAAGYSGVRGVPPAAGSFPVIVFSHAASSTPTQSVFLTSHLASYGYIVAAPSHPGTTWDDCVGCYPQDKQVAMLTKSRDSRPDEVSFALDLVAGLNSDPYSAFFGVADTSRAAVIGHSWGGYTAVRSIEQDGRFKAAVAMAPVADQLGSDIQQVARDIHRPMLIMASELDDITPYPPQLRMFEGLPADAPAILLSFPRGGHPAYSEICPVETPGCGPNDLGQQRAHDLVRAYVTSFRRAWVDGDPRYLSVFASGLGGNDVRVANKQDQP